jgi:hypothetical protein
MRSETLFLLIIHSIPQKEAEKHPVFLVQAQTALTLSIPLRTDSLDP